MNDKLKDFLGFSINLVFILILALVIVTFICQRTVVDGHSMEDSLFHGDSIIVNKLTYKFNEPQRFDVIVFPYRYENKTLLIKRIIGLPGETVYIDPDGNIFIDDVLLEENYGLERIKRPGIASVPITLGEDEYFVLGDNRNNSMDSRYESVGNVKFEDITGKAWIRIYPFSRLGIVSKIK